MSDPSQDPVLYDLIFHYSTTVQDQDLIEELYYANNCNYFQCVKVLNQLFCGKDSKVKPLNETPTVIHAPDGKNKRKRNRGSAAGNKNQRQKSRAAHRDALDHSSSETSPTSQTNQAWSTSNHHNHPLFHSNYVHPKNVQFLHSMFPDLPEQVVKNILLDSQSNMDKTTEILLDFASSFLSEQDRNTTDSASEGHDWQLVDTNTKTCGGKKNHKTSYAYAPPPSVGSSPSPSSSPKSKLTHQQRTTVVGFVEMFPFLTEQRIVSVAKKFQWHESRICTKLAALQEKVKKGEDEDEDNVNNLNQSPSERYLAHSQLELKMDFPALNPDQSVSEEFTPTVNDLQHIQNCVDQLFNLFGKRIDKELVCQAFAQCSHSFSKTKTSLEEMFPGALVEQTAQNILTSEDTGPDNGIECTSPSNNSRNIYSKGWQKIKKKSPPKRVGRNRGPPPLLVVDRHELLMDEARTLAQERWSVVMKAIACYKGGDVSNAQRYSQDALSLRQEISHIQTKAYQLLHHAERGITDSSVTILDLHGYSVEEACSLFLKHLAAMRKLHVGCFQCITGKGAHSHKKQAKIRPAIKKLCNSRKVQFVEKKLGILEVRV
uniref:Smr domain-containing protein n=1 Tax=Percolomonas cosmopolitus TaxID=63605 RepID=A0A7S1KPP2_9EUKA|mmetsp:Transcript_1956/g.7029  ORF Transcript_1956/g.7029 Transcript_1956/m.7029 type:complete len:600 (+) Transcript_1956:2336-4135(+)